MYLSKLFKRFFSILLLLLASTLLYIFTAFSLTFFPAHSSNINTNKNETIYILYDEMHSDIVLNLKSTTQPWATLFPTLIKEERGYITFGWGDKETYLNTPTWDKLKLSTALKALFTNSPSLMHVSYYPHLEAFQNLKKITLTKAQQRALEASIFKSFNFKAETYKGHRFNDLFQSSSYTYNLLNTCNTWTGKTLRDANISVSYWTPFSQNVIDSLP